jgi:hypothetical protein
MQTTENLVLARRFSAFVAIIASLVISFSMPTVGQTHNAGDNAICTSASGCTTAPSPAFIDASVLGATNTDICAVLRGIHNSSSYPATGAVIDARGFPGT